MSDVSLNVHDVESVDIEEAEMNEIEYSGRIYYSRRINIKAEKGSVSIVLFSDHKEKLK